MEELSTKYDYKKIEEKWYRYWEENKFFHAEINFSKEPFTIVIPPPNITGILHMGHALNNTIQDILTRHKKMCGFEALWMPGTDHAGIATQNVVERKLAKEKLTRQDLGREKFLEKVWEWKNEYGSTIIQQLKRLGCACDWERVRFTMDNGYSNAVTEVFVRLYEKGLIYRGNYIINWCPRCQTALSDEEAPHHEIDGFLYYIKYPLKNSGEHIVVATTRPETMLGDTAVAVNPHDKRYKLFVGKTAILPLIGREIKIIKDDFVDPKFGTGAVKVTPAHDPNDYQIGKRHGLEFINIMHSDGRLNANAGDYAEDDRFEAREAIIEQLKERKLLLKTEPHKHAVGHCYRCHTIIEPYLSKQWFVKMKPLSLPAVKTVREGKIKIHPSRWTKVYLNWMENIQDWCISRQIWWGHRLPVYYCRNCFVHEENEITNAQSKNKGIIVSKTKPEKCPFCDSTSLFQDEDVLDTWFSSWLWPFATFGWPFQDPCLAGRQERSKIKNKKEEELKYFYPTSVLVTAQEIIFFWVARMIMAGIEFNKQIPFKDVYIHGTVRDDTGKKMSKSLGNIIDPIEIINEYGTDALRFSLISITSIGQDVFLSKDKFELGRNFANKIWNAARFILLNLEKEKTNEDLCLFLKNNELPLAEAWILSRFYSVLTEINNALESYRFNEAAGLIYEFFWHQFCDWYIELAKLNIKEKNTQLVLYKVLEKTLRVLHPFMPFITEEIYQKLNPSAGSIMKQSWPHVQKDIINKKLEMDMGLVIQESTVIRNLRSEANIKPAEKSTVAIFIEDKEKQKILNDYAPYLKNLAKTSELKFLEKNLSPFVSFKTGTAFECGVTYLNMGGNIDTEAEKKKILLQLEQINKSISQKEALLNNPQFVKKAPMQVVEKEKLSISRFKEEADKLNKILSRLRCDG